MVNLVPQPLWYRIKSATFHVSYAHDGYGWYWHYPIGDFIIPFDDNVNDALKRASSKQTSKRYFHWYG